jgi:hypothetical protein
LPELEACLAEHAAGSELSVEINTVTWCMISINEALERVDE